MPGIQWIIRCITTAGEAKEYGMKVTGAGNVVIAFDSY
jgi:hypothetical protein